MSDFEPIAFSPRSAGASSGPGSKSSAKTGNHGNGQAAVRATVQSVVTFDRKELGQILAVYGRQVAQGEWRDYALDMMSDKAVFSIFRKSSEVPLYRIEKVPKLARRQGAFAVITPTGLILKRGHDLLRVLAAIDKKLSVVA